MPVYKAKDKTKDGRQWFFVISYTNRNGDYEQFKSKKYLTKQEATKEEALYQISKQNEVKGAMTFQDLYYEYLNYAKSRLKERTLNINDGRIRLHVLPYFKDKKIDKITTKDIIIWQDELNAKNYSHDYKSTIFVNFNTIMQFGVRHFGLRLNPLSIVGNFKSSSEIKKEMNYWTKNEFELFIKEVDDPIYNAFYAILFFTGMRCGEAQALTWNDFKDNSLNINKTLTTKIKGKQYILTSPKTKKSNRTIKLSDRVILKLNELKTHYKKYDNYSDEWFIFGGIEPLPETTIRRKKEKACIKAGVKNIRIHDFRHSFATLLINNGIMIQIISEMLGHEKVSTTTDIYGHLYPNQQNIAIDKLNNL